MYQKPFMFSSRKYSKRKLLKIKRQKTLPVGRVGGLEHNPEKIHNLNKMKNFIQYITCSEQHLFTGLRCVICFIPANYL